MKETWEKSRVFLGKISKKNRILLGVVFSVIILGAVIFALMLNHRPYAVLFTGLSGEEARSITSYLQDNGVNDYRIQGSDTILVPAGQEEQLKAKLLMAGYPKSGFAYETYRSAVTGMSTQADREIAFLQDLQDRMAGVIRCFSGVKEAVVTISQGEDRRFVLSDDSVVEATASVLVTMDGGTALTAQQAEAIRNLVSHAVKGLSISNVAISDSLGNDYGANGAVGGAEDASQLKLRLEEQVNNKVRTQIMTVLAPLYGADNVRVGVQSTVDISRRVGESTTYTEPGTGEADGKGILNSRVYDHTVTRGGEDGVGGVAGTQSNADLPSYVEGGLEPDGTETLIRTSGEDKYSVNSEKQQVDNNNSGVVTDVMVAVTINGSVAGGASREALLQHVAKAAGIGTQDQEEKISILIAPFYDPGSPLLPPASELPRWVVIAAAAGTALMLAVLLLLSALRRRKRKKQMAQAAALAVRVPATAEPPQEGADIMNIKTEKSMELRKDIRQFAEDDPELAAQMVKSWLRGGEE